MAAGQVAPDIPAAVVTEAGAMRGGAVQMPAAPAAASGVVRIVQLSQRVTKSTW